MRPLALDGRALATLLTDDRSDWTVIRMPRLVEGGAMGAARVGRLRVGLRSVVTSGDVAAFALRCVERGDQVREMLMIASARARGGNPADRLHLRQPTDVLGTSGPANP